MTKRVAQCLAVLAIMVMTMGCESVTGGILNGRTIVGAPVYPFDKDGKPKAVRVEAMIVNLPYLTQLEASGLLDPKTGILACQSLENHHFRTTGSDRNWKVETEGFILTSFMHETDGYCGVTQKEGKLYFAPEVDPFTGRPVRPKLKHWASFGDATLADKLAVALVNAGGQVMSAGLIAFGDIEAASRIASGLRHQPANQITNNNTANGGEGGRGGNARTGPITIPRDPGHGGGGYKPPHGGGHYGDRD